MFSIIHWLIFILFIETLLRVESTWPRRRRSLSERLSTETMCSDSTEKKYFCASLEFKRISESAPYPVLYRRAPSYDALEGDMSVTVYYNCQNKTRHRFVHVSILIIITVLTFSLIFIVLAIL